MRMARTCRLHSARIAERSLRRGRTQRDTESTRPGAARDKRRRRGRRDVVSQRTRTRSARSGVCAAAGGYGGTRYRGDRHRHRARSRGHGGCRDDRAREGGRGGAAGARSLGPAAHAQAAAARGVGTGACPRAGAAVRADGVSARTVGPQPAAGARASAPRSRHLGRRRRARRVRRPRARPTAALGYAAVRGRQHGSDRHGPRRARRHPHAAARVADAR